MANRLTSVKIVLNTCITITIVITNMILALSAVMKKNV